MLNFSACFKFWIVIDSGLRSAHCFILENDENESDNFKELRADINKAIEILSNLIQSHSILFYIINVKYSFQLLILYNNIIIFY